jgi:SAM-dependent methyltransferase
VQFTNKKIIQKADALSISEKAKFITLPKILHDWVKDFGGLSGKRILDFGCGEGTSAAGIAILYDAIVHGTDINNESDACTFFLQTNFGIDIPETLTFQEIIPGGDIHGDNYDCVFSWSVFEHVHNRIYDDVLSDLYNRIKPGGLFFMQISPLYFAPEGSHLWAIGYDKWDHLLNQYSDVRADLQRSDLDDGTKAGLLNMFDTLNRVTADDIIERFTAAGFELLRQQRDMVDHAPPIALLRAYSRDALMTYQIAAVFRRPEPITSM